MAALPHAESWRLYSWWWDSHISPRNSRWLQDDLTDMDTRVKLMIKLIEDDGDSFAMRAEMYYKRRPELMKLVEEFYRAYRSLAERYDHATRALRQAHRAMTKTLHNCACPSPDSPSSSPCTDSDCSTPRMPIRSQCFFNAEDGPPCHFHAPRNGEFDPLTWRRGLKQVNEMFASSGGSKLSTYREKGESKCQNFHEQSMKESEFELHGASKGAKIEENNKNHLEELMKFQDGEIYGVNEENNKEYHEKFEGMQSMQDGLGRRGSPDRYREEFEVTVDNNRTNCRESEVELQTQVLEKHVLELEEDNDNLHLMVEHVQKEVEELKVELQDEHLKVLQTEAALESLEEQHRRLKERLEIVSAERQRCCRTAREREMKVNMLEENLKQVGDENCKLQGEVEEKTEEIRGLYVSVEEERLRSAEIERKLSSLEKLCSRCKSEMGLLARGKRDVEQKVGVMEEKRQCLQDEKVRLQEIVVRKKEALREENSLLKERVNNLELRQMEVISKMDGLRMEIQSLRGSSEALQDENSSILKEYICATYEEEKELLLKTNESLAIRVNDAEFQMEELKRRVISLDESDATLQERNSILESEKGVLIHEKNAMQEDMRKLLEKNLFLENSLGDADRKMEGIEEILWSLSEENFLLQNSQDALISQVEGFTRNLKYLEEGYAELHDKYSSLETEKDSALHEVSQLQCLLNMEKQGRERAICSSCNRIDALHDDAIHSSKEIQNKQAEIVNKEHELFGGALVSFIFQRCLSDLKDKNSFLSKRQEREFCDHQKRIRQLLEDGVGDDLKEKMSLTGKASRIDEFDQMDVFKKIEELKGYSSQLEYEKHRSVIEAAVCETFLCQLAQDMAENQLEGCIELEIPDDQVRLEGMASKEMQAQILGLQCELLGTSLELCWANVVREELEETISWMTVNLDHQRKEALFVEERNEILEEELDKLKKENVELRAKGEKLTSDLLNEVSCHEKESMALIEDSHLAVVSSMLCEEKARELMKMHENLKIGGMAEIMPVDAEMARVEKARELMKMHKNLKIRGMAEIMPVDAEMARVEELSMECDNKEEENKQLKAELDECRVLVSSLNESVSYLEDCIHLSRKHQGDAADTKAEISHERPPGPKMPTELENLIRKLDEIQKYVTETKGRGVGSTFPSNTIMENQVHRTSKGIDGEKEIHVVFAKDYRRRDDNCKNPDNRDEVILKDIQLDRSASITRHGGCNGLNESNRDTYDQVWQTDKRRQDSEIKKAHLSVIDEDGKQLMSSSKESEMELALDKAQVSKKDVYSQHDWSNIVEQLSLNAERLTTLQASVWELRRKLQTIGRSNQANNLEFGATQEQLKHTQDSILQLVRTNAKLMRRARGCSSPCDSNNVDELEQARNQQQKAMECARRESRKIGKLELEVQQVQCTVLELEEGVERRRTRATRRESRVVLSDYLFGRAERRRSHQFCGCVETKDHRLVKRSLVKEGSF